MFWLIGVILLLYFYKKTISKNVIKKIPCPPEHFFLGHLPLLVSKPEIFFNRSQQFAKEYYPIYRYSTFYSHTVHILHPDDVKLVLSSSKHMTKGKLYSLLHKWLGEGLLTSTGKKWYHRRKVLTPAFHFSILQEFVEDFNKETGFLIKSLEKDCGEIIDVVPPITDFTLRTISNTVMGLSTIEAKTQEKYRNAICEMASVILERMVRPWYFINFLYKKSNLCKREAEVLKVLHGYSDLLIRKREKDQERRKNKIMVDILLNAKNERGEIDFLGIREEVDTFMFEGHDTTSLALSYTLLCLSNHQTIQSKILNEILTTIGPTAPPTYETLQALKYTERCIKEALRLFPSVPLVMRRASETFTTSTGYTIPEGTTLNVNIFALHRNARFFPNPLKFDPDRFLDSQRHPFAYVAFSAGPRNCIGQKFALLELKAALCGILRCFKLEKVDDYRCVKFKSDIVLRSQGPIRVRFVKRNEINSIDCLLASGWRLGA